MTIASGRGAKRRHSEGEEDLKRQANEGDPGRGWQDPLVWGDLLVSCICRCSVYPRLGQGGRHLILLSPGQPCLDPSSARRTQASFICPLLVHPATPSLCLWTAPCLLPRAPHECRGGNKEGARMACVCLSHVCWQEGQKGPRGVTLSLATLGKFCALERQGRNPLISFYLLPTCCLAPWHLTQQAPVPEQCADGSQPGIQKLLICSPSPHHSLPPSPGYLSNPAPSFCPLPSQPPCPDSS